MDATISDAKRKVLERLKRADGATAGELASELGVTEAAVRLHLDALAAHGLVVARERAAAGRGRPPLEWALTDVAVELFPDHHADLTVELLDALRAAVGDAGVDAVIEARTGAQLESYRSVIDAGAPPRRRLDALARRRTAEGYMAEVRRDGASYLLVEHHCPICSAARACAGLCRGELELFRRALGDDVEVAREQHVLAGDARCVYRVSAR